MEIRIATPSDAGQIANIMKSVWPEQVPDAEKIRIQLARDEHQSFVAEVGDSIVGFVDCFMTTAMDGSKRVELDLMAVLPSFQGQGIGKQLVEAGIGAAEYQAADIIRALVQIDNVTSSTALERRGFETDDVIHMLNISSQVVSATKVAPESLYIVPVHTFSYNGIWLENDFSEAALLYGQHRRSEESLDVVGVLIPTQQMNDGIRQSGYTQIDEYRWWTRRL